MLTIFLANVIKLFIYHMQVNLKKIKKLKTSIRNKTNIYIYYAAVKKNVSQSEKKIVIFFEE